MFQLQKSTQKNKSENQIFIFNDINKVNHTLTKQELSYVQKELDKKHTWVEVNKYEYSLIFVQCSNQKKQAEYLYYELCRKSGKQVCDFLNKRKIKEVYIKTQNSLEHETMLFMEGLLLTNYQFLKYFSKSSDKKNTLHSISVESKNITNKQLDELKYTTQAVYIARNLVNEPVIHLTAQQLSKEIEILGKESGFSVEVFNKKKIESLKMGGLLSVNMGSVEPPTFSILEWKPAKAKNKKPLVLVGKGVVYDTGGLSLKPTKGSMDEMKCDMAGAASVAAVMYAIAKNKLPVHVIGLIPATDNRPGGNAYTPGDVITMYNGKTVEVLNTDAEGRLILADALAYGQKYKPELVIDYATLTGAAQMAVGSVAAVCMGVDADEDIKNLEKSGEQVYERLVNFPMWDEYGEMIKSDIADIKNVGGPYAGAITAGKFLEVFMKDKNDKQVCPWIHIDIAGPAFLSSSDAYKPKGGTGYGVRLTYEFIKKKYGL